MYRRCPYCDAEIAARALKCRYCGEWLDAARPVPWYGWLFAFAVLATAMVYFLASSGRLIPIALLVVAGVTAALVLGLRGRRP